MKRMLSLLLCLTMVLSFAAPTMAQAAENDDVFANQDSLIDGVDLGQNVQIDNLVIDNETVSFNGDAVIGTPGGEASFPQDTEYKECYCESLGSMIEHSGECEVKNYYSEICGSTAEEIYARWSDFTLVEKEYILNVLSANYALTYTYLQEMLAVPTGSDEAKLTDGTVVSVDWIPENGSVSVGEATDDVKGIVESYVEENVAGATELFTWDVSVRDEQGTEWQPEFSVHMELEVPGVTLHKHAKVYVVHVDDNGVASTIEATVTEDGKIAFETPGFSTFAGFTVDFEYDGQGFSMVGLESILLSEVMDKLKMPLYVEDVASVSFSDTTLISVEKQGSDWLLTSLKAFQTSEYLTVTMNNGDVYDILVTDRTNAKISIGSASNADQSGGDGVVTWQLDEDGVPYKYDGWSYTQNIYITGPGVMEIHLQNASIYSNFSSTVYTNLKLYLRSIIIQDGAEVTFRLGGSFKGADSITIRGQGNCSMFDVINGSLLLRCSDSSLAPTGAGPSYFADQTTEGTANDQFVSMILDAQNLNTSIANSVVYLGANAKNFYCEDVIFRNSKSRAVLCRSNELSSLVMKDCTFENTVQVHYNHGQNGGGAIRLDSYTTGIDPNASNVGDRVDIGKFVLNNCKFQNVKGNDNGGAIESYARIATTEIKNSTFDGCVAQQWDAATGNTTEYGAYGGACAFYGYMGKVLFDGCLFNGCKAKTRGGAVYFSMHKNAGNNWSRINEITFQNCDFKNCRSRSSHGGAIATESQIHTLKILGCNFEECSALANGGALSLGYMNIGDGTGWQNYFQTSSGAEDTQYGVRNTAVYTWGTSRCTTLQNLVIDSYNGERSSFKGCFANQSGGAIEFAQNSCTYNAQINNTDMFACRSSANGSVLFVSTAIVQFMDMDNVVAKYNTSMMSTPLVINDVPILLSSSKNYIKENGTYYQVTLNGNTSYTKTKDANGAYITGSNTAAYYDAYRKLDEGWYEEAPYTLNKTTWEFSYKPSDPTSEYIEVGESSGTIRSTGNSTCELTMNNCWLEKNYSDASGGGLYWNANNERDLLPQCSATVVNSTFVDNSSLVDGGGIYCEANLVVDNCKIYNNTCNRYGAGIAQQVYSNSGRMMKDGEQTNLTLKNNTEVYNNYSNNCGGGVSIRANPTVSLVNVDANGNIINKGEEGFTQHSVLFNLQDSTVRNNTAKVDGGGVYYLALMDSTAYNHKTGLTAEQSKEINNAEVNSYIKRITISNGSIYSNRSGVAQDDTTGSVQETLNGGNGGGICMISSANTELSIASGTIYKNTAVYGNGGGIYLSGKDALCTVSGGTVGGSAENKNVAQPNETGTTVAKGNGGGIAIYGGARIEMTGGTISYNEAYVGGGIAVREGSSMLSDKSQDGTAALIDNNTATSAGGGIAVHDKSTMTINDGTVTNNTSAYGGGISVMSSGDKTTIGSNGENWGMIFNGGQISQNLASRLGGGICLSDNSTMKLTGGQITDNRAADMVESSGKVDYNYINSTEYTHEGGGVAVCQGSQMDIYGGVISGNHSYHGGGLVVRGGSTLKMYSVEQQNGTAAGATITKNEAHGTSSNGGGIYAVASKIFMYGGKITDNDAVAGGGLNVGNNSEVYIDGGEITYNEAVSGGGIYIQGVTNQEVGKYTTKLDMVGGSISHNKATGTGTYNGQGGGIHADRCVEITISGKDNSDEVGDISNNTAAKGGGVYLCWGAHLTVINGHIVNNQAKGSNSSFTTTNMNNHGLLGVGGGVYVTSGYDDDNPSVFTLKGSESGANIAIYGNTAEFAADDVFANAEKTQLNLPLVGDMNLSGYPLPAVGWVEDYPVNDTEYELGLNHGAEKGIANGKNVYRYRFANAYYRILVPEKNAAGEELSLSAFTPNQPNTYACLTLGTPSAMADTVVIDYGLPVKIDVKSNDTGLSDVTSLEKLGALRPVPEGNTVDYTEGGLDQNWGSNTGCRYGTATIDGQMVCYTPNTLIMDNKDSFSYALKYTRGSGADATDFYFYSSVTVIPATSIYYEDNFKNENTENAIKYTVYDLVTDKNGNVTESLNTSTDAGVQWASTGSTSNQYYQQEDRPGIQGGTDYNNIYGYDPVYDQSWPYYSLNTAMKVNVNSNKSAKAQFTFKGRGFDILAVTNNISGTIIVKVDRLDDTSVADRYYLVDTYYGYTYDSENNKWTVDTQFDNASAHLYQIPVMKVEGLDYGEYAVDICLAYDKMFDHRNLGYYSFYLEGIRIYNPADDGVISTGTNSTMVEDTTIRDAYIADGEYAPTYYEIRDLLLDENALDVSGVTGAVFVDGIDSVDSASIIKYQHYGPNNEVYLGRGQAIAFNMNFSGNVAGVHIGMKRLLEEADVKIFVLENGKETEVLSKTLKSTSELYFDISSFNDTSLNGKTIVIKNASTDTTKSQVISLTNLKVTDFGAGLASGEIPWTMDKSTANYVLSYFNAEEPTITLKYPTLSFESEINFNVYFAIDGVAVDAENMGLIMFNSELTDGTIADADKVIPGAIAQNGLMMVRSCGIAAKNLGDKQYFKVYAKLADGTYVYSSLASYSAAEYAVSVLNNANSSDAMKALVTAMLKYGTAAQQFFGYNTDNLLLSAVDDAIKFDICDYDVNMLKEVAAVDTDRTAQFANNGGFALKYPNVSFEGAFAINYYFVPAYEVEGDMVLYYWDQETYDTAQMLTVDNAAGFVKAVRNENGEYIASCTGIAAKDVDSAIYVAAVYENNGVTYSSGVLPYSIGAYCAENAANGSAVMQAFAKATAVYSWYAKSYFANV